MSANKPEKLECIVLISGPSRDYLNERQRVDYESHRQKLLKWLGSTGKNPDTLEGYAHHTAKNYASIIDRFLRDVWKEDGYTLGVSHKEAEEYLRSLVLADDEYSRTHLHNTKLSRSQQVRGSVCSGKMCNNPKRTAR